MRNAMDDLHKKVLRKFPQFVRAPFVKNNNG